MNQSRYGVLVSLCLLLILAAGFFVAASYAVRAVKTNVDKAIATATVVVLPPSPSPVPASPTPHGYKKKPQHPVVAVPPTATPAAGAAQIVVSSTNSMQDAASTLPGTLSQYWCLADLPTTPLSAQIVWRWQQVTGNTVSEVYTSNPYTYASTIREGFVDGPLATGQYRCEVLVNNQLIGDATFTVK